MSRKPSISALEMAAMESADEFRAEAAALEFELVQSGGEYWIMCSNGAAHVIGTNKREAEKELRAARRNPHAFLSGAGA